MLFPIAVPIILTIKCAYISFTRVHLTLMDVQKGLTMHVTHIIRGRLNRITLTFLLSQYTVLYVNKASSLSGSR